MNVYVDDVMITSWTSSGTSTAFENIDLGAITGQTVELRGVLEGSEWLSIMEVEVLVDDGADSGSDDDGTAVVVEAGMLSTVTATADLYDPRLSNENGCDPDGCTAALTRDGDVSEGSRWSCSPSLGGTCSISYDLGATRDLSQLRLAMYKGASRARTMDVHVGGVLATTWTSSGTTINFESIDLVGYSGRYITITGILVDDEWLSIVETEIMVLADDTVPPPPSPTTTTPAPVSAPTATTTPAPAFAPVATPVPTSAVPTPEQLYAAKEVEDIGGTVTATAALYDPNVLADGGCDPAGCTAELTRGDSRQVTMEVRVDGVLITTFTTSGTTAGADQIVFTGLSGQVVELTGVLDDSEWLSIVETEIMVWPDIGVTTPPSPTPTPTATPAPAPAVQPPIQPPVTPEGDLVTVGLLPLASGTGDDLLAFYAKDGDFSTAWTCSAGVCELRFNLFNYRHIKQVKIALTDGAEHAVDMRLASRYNSDLGSAYVTSSGTTDGLETYEFDVFTNEIFIQAVFSPDAQTISISEVEFVEAHIAGEIPVSYWDPPSYDDGNGPTSDGFEWTSDSVDAIDQVVYFELGAFALVDAVEIKFAAGDTYKFDLVITDGKVYDEPINTIEGLESADSAEWQSFDLSQHVSPDQYLTEIDVIIKGTGSGAPGFKMLDFRVVGTIIDNPTDVLHVGSTFIERWNTQQYPDFVALGSSDQMTIMEAICTVKKASFDGVDCVGGDDTATGTVGSTFIERWSTQHYPDFVALGSSDQMTIMEAICTVKKASFDGVDCVGGDDTATGTVVLDLGNWFVDGNIFMKSGVFLDGGFNGDEPPNFTGIILQEGAAGKTDIDAIVVMDGISNAKTQNIWVRGLYDPETSNGSSAVSGLGSICVSVVGSTNITLEKAELRFCDGDALVVRNTNLINIDAGEYDDQYRPWSLASSRGTGLLVDSCDSIYVRRHTLYENGVAGIHIIGSNNFTFDATIGRPDSTVDTAQGNVGTTDGQQPIEIIIEGSTLLTFNDLRVQSSNDPVMTITDSSAVSFNNMGLSDVLDGACVIQTDDPSVVTIDADEDELSLEGTCYVKDGTRGTSRLLAKDVTKALQSHLQEAGLPTLFTVLSFRVGGSLSRSMAGEAIEQIMQVWGGRTEEIARTANAIKNRYYSTIRRRQKHVDGQGRGAANFTADMESSRAAS
eukprot:g13321.t1